MIRELSDHLRRLAIFRLVLYVLAASNRSWGRWEFLIPSQLSGDITWFQYAWLSWRWEANIPARKRIRHVYLEANRILFNVNQPKAKTTNMPVYMPRYAATCSLYSVDRSFAYVVHSWLIIDLPDRRSPSISNHILYLDHPIYSRSWHLDNWA